MSDFNIYVTTSLTSSERRISPQWDLHYLKSRLELITGIPPQYQTIVCYPTANSNDTRKLAAAEEYDEEKDKLVTVAELGLAPFSRLEVVDANPDLELHDLANEMDEDTIDPDKEFKLSEEKYSLMSNTVLSWKQRNQLGRFDPTYDSEKARAYEENAALAAKMSVGQRCRVINIAGERRGLVKFVGTIDVLDKGENVWVGIEFDEPVGKNSGVIDGVRIFQCRPSHGSFVKPKQVEVGDFPELDLFESDDEDEEL